MITLNAWAANVNGRAINTDGQYGAQCWDAGSDYSMRVVGVPKSNAYGLPTGDGCAAGVYYNFKALLPNYYTRIKNTVNALPKPGDIIVWGYGLPGSGGAGHLAVVLQADWNGFTSMDQNWAGAYCHKVRHNWNYVVGWLRPKRNVNTATPTPAPAPAVQYYVVKSGDSLSSIGGRYGKTVAQMVAMNKGTYPSLASNPNLIKIGWKLRVK